MTQFSVSLPLFICIQFVLCLVVLLVVTIGAAVLVQMETKHQKLQDDVKVTVTALREQDPTEMKELQTQVCE